MIEQFDRTNLRFLRDDINTALQAVAQKHGIKIECGTARYAAANCTFKIECGVQRDGGFASKESEDFKRYHHLFGLLADDLGKTFQHRNTVYTIAGLHPNRRARPVVCTTPNGKQYLFAAHDIAILLDRKPSLKDTWTTPSGATVEVEDR